MFDTGPAVVYISLDEVDGMHERALGAEIPMPPTDQDYEYPGSCHAALIGRDALSLLGSVVWEQPLQQDDGVHPTPAHPPTRTPSQRLPTPRDPAG